MAEGHDRCGHVTASSGVDDAGAVCCWRHTWADADRCIWHTDEAVPAETYERTAPDSGERLDGANFRGAVLSGSTVLAGCSLVDADFTDAVVDDADLSETDLRRATFRDVDAHGTSFRNATIHDAVFVFVDLRGADFRGAKLYRAGLTDVRINLETTFGERTVYEEELSRLSDEGGADADERTERADSAQWVYRELQRLYDENAFPEQVHTYYLREMNFRRRNAWRVGNYLRALKLAGSRWVMQYGTNPWRVVATSLVLILVCAGLYPLTGGVQEIGTDTAVTYEIDDPTDTSGRVLLQAYLKSLYFSVVTFATLGYGDIQPVGQWARAIAGIETLLGSLLMALLVFVLTRSVRY